MRLISSPVEANSRSSSDTAPCERGTLASEREPTGGGTTLSTAGVAAGGGIAGNRNTLVGGGRRQGRELGACLIGARAGVRRILAGGRELIVHLREFLAHRVDRRVIYRCRRGRGDRRHWVVRRRNIRVECGILDDSGIDDLV